VKLVVRGQTVDLSQPVLMGIASDVARAVELVAQGATIVDVVAGEETIRVVQGIRHACPEALISVATSEPSVVEAGLDAGADLSFFDQDVVPQHHPPPDPALPSCAVAAAPPLSHWRSVTERLGRPLVVDLSESPGLVETLAAVGNLIRSDDPSGLILRVHDVDAVADYLAVAAVLNGRADLDPEAQLAIELRREPVRPPGGL
jgi:hypothetical protein